MKYQRRASPLSRAKASVQHQHADDWLMTYADMITLLLCFFAIFLSISIAKKGEAEKNLAKFQSQQEIAKQDPFQGNLPFFGISQALEEDAAEERKSLAKALENQEGAKVEQEGDRLTTLDINSAAFFDSGSATLSDAGKKILSDIYLTIRDNAERGYEVTVEGHTDDAPIKTAQFPSNWELSTARAAAVVHFFLDEGLSPQKIRAAGYADAYPLVPNRDADGNPIAANQAQNRRVVIKLEKVEKQRTASAATQSLSN